MSIQLSITYIPLHEIVPSPLNPRKHFDATSLQELAASIQAEGVLQPILVRMHPNGLHYEIVAGERRHRASLLAGLETIPCIIRELTEDEALEIMITENLQRQDIHPMEEAAGFQQLIKARRMDIRELAARVGKSPAFVSQRLKLCELIQPIQEHFFRGLLLVKDAITLSQLAADDQQDFYDTTLDGNDDYYEVTDWDLRKYKNRLDNAPFDTTDASLLKGQPQCTICPYNSASSLLFSDASEKAICHNSACFRAKCDRTYEIQLEQAIANPEVVLITGQRYARDKIDKDVKVFDLHPVLPFSDYQIIDMPEAPDREYYDGDNDTPAEDQADFERALAEYKAEMAAFQKKVKSARFTRAFVLGGDDKGKYVYVQLKKDIPPSATTSTGSVDSGDLTEDDIMDEMKEIQRSEAAAIGQNRNNRWKEIRELCDPVSYVKASANNKLSFNEVQALAQAIYGTLDHWNGEEDSFRELFFGGDEGTSIPEGYLKAPHLLADMLRFFIIAQLPPSAAWMDEDQRKAELVESILAEYYEHAIDEIGMRHAQIADQRAAEAAKRIKALESKLKALRPKAPKKGKGIKALISDTTSA